MFVLFVESSGKNIHITFVILETILLFFPFSVCSFWHKIYVVLTHFVQHGFFPYFELIPAV